MTPPPEAGFLLSWKGMRTVIMTEDGVELAGLYRRADAPRGAVLLLHMMPATKESWDAFADAILPLGLSSLAIDLRGHGESVRQGDRLLDYRQFTDGDHRAKALDAEAAAGWLLGKEAIGFDRLAVAGASIGANLAIRFGAEHPDIPAVLALSPGLDYRGVTTADAFASLPSGQSVFIAASEEDAVSWKSVKILESSGTRASAVFRFLKGAGHGTAMFESDPPFMAEAAEWLSGNFR